MKQLRFFPVLLLAMAWLLSACALASENQFSAPSMAFEASEEFVGAESAPREASSAPGSTQDLDLSQQSDVAERLIIRTANLEIVVEDTEDAVSRISRMADNLGGWVVETSFRDYNGGKSGRMTIRVPAESYERALDQIKGLATEVEFEGSNSQDVTEEYVDLSARLANLEATADRVRAFLDEARNVEEALNVNRELSRLEGEIESLKGRIQYLTQSAAFSTITISITPSALALPLQVGRWRPEGVARDALETLVGALQDLADAAIWLGIFCLPLGLLIGVPLFFAVRFGWRRWGRGRSGRAAAEKSGEAGTGSEAGEGGDEPAAESPAD
jgi:hypothetical protein